MSWRSGQKLVAAPAMAIATQGAAAGCKRCAPAITIIAATATPMVCAHTIATRLPVSLNIKAMNSGYPGGRCSKRGHCPANQSRTSV